MSTFVSTRIKAEEVLGPNYDPGDGFEIDMVRRCSTKNIEDAAKYYLLEHLLRPYTSDSDFAMLSEALRGPVLNFVQSLRQFVAPDETAIYRLEQEFQREFLRDIEQITRITHFVWNGDRLIEKVSCPNRPRLLKSFVCTVDGNVYIAYSAEMNLVDGYGPESGAKRKPLVYEGLLKRIFMEFYYTNPDYNRFEKAKHVRVSKKIVEKSPVKAENISPRPVEEPVQVPKASESSESIYSAKPIVQKKKRGMQLPRNRPKKWLELEKESQTSRKHREQCETCALF